MSSPKSRPQEKIFGALCLFLLVFTLDCSDESEPRVAPSGTVIDLSNTGSCDALDRQSCLSSTECTLHHDHTSVYACRPAQGACEEGLVQTDRVACEAREGCNHAPGTCYCPLHGQGRTSVPDRQSGSSEEAAACTCAGGPPPICAPTE